MDLVVVEKTLQELEGLIERGLQTFVEVGQALMEIRDRRLYHEQNFTTFEAYCRERWGWSKTHANRQIQAAQVAQNLAPMGVILASERQARELAKLPAEQQREVAERLDLSRATGHDVHMAVHFSSATEEWYTPPEIISRVIRVLGAIDLDPCSNSGEPNVPAGGHFTVQEDGLSRPWPGRVYMNPPYGRVIGDWVAKLLAEHESGAVPEAIALVPARTGTEWFRLFRDCAVCFVDGRLKFSGHENSAPFPSAVVYLGGDIDRFHDGFSDLGDIWVRWSR